MKFLIRVFALVMVVSLAMSVSVLAETQESVNVICEEELNTEDSPSIGLRYTYIKSMGLGLTIDNNREAFIYTECKTYNTVDSIAMKTELQRNDGGTWKTIKTYNAEEADAIKCSIDKSYYVTRTYEYRLKMTVTVKNGSGSESDTKYSTEQTCYSIIEEI